MTPKTKVVSVRLPEEIKNGLRRLAIATDRSVGYHAQKAIERYLKEEVPDGRKV